MTKYYEEKLQQGLYYQDFVIEQLYKIGLPLISYSSKEFQNRIGENKAGIEIKNDQKFRQTNNFYIEVSEKSNANNLQYVKSGIYRNDNTWLYLIGDFKSIYIFSKKQLILLYEKKIFRKVETPTSIGYLLPLKNSEKYCIKKIGVINENSLA
jgi:hypothetical protein